MDRVLTFGKYKGQPVKKVTLEHIGYIMWCLSNLGWFKLTDEEQTIYDAIAIAIIKYGIKMVFPDEAMLAQVRDREKLEKKDTPFIMRGDGMIRFKEEDRDHPIIQSVLTYFKPKREAKDPLLYLPELQHVANKIIECSFPDWQGVDYDDY